MLPDLESLACFEAAARTLSFRRASELVHLSPVAFGDRIRHLEDDLGQALFRRTTRKVELTAAGQRLLAHASKVLADARACRNVVASAAPLPYELTIGTRFELGMSWLVPGLTEFSRRRPERSLHLYFGNGADLLARARNGTIDAAISSARLNTTGLRYAPLHEESYVFVGSKKGLGRRVPTSASDVRDLVLIDASKDLPLFRYLQDSVREDIGFARIELLGTIAAIRARVLEGAGVAVLPEYFVRRDLEVGRMIELFKQVRLGTDHFRLIWREGHALEASIVELAGELQARPLE
ncbi:MAG: LysR family transcriptional regulator [Deltaproteobacteria bacterium]|nr:LysR family transcriptional regulator [Deltaproteobacteria bacterium]